jgi:hypothetical protein
MLQRPWDPTSKYGRLSKSASGLCDFKSHGRRLCRVPDNEKPATRSLGHYVNRWSSFVSIAKANQFLQFDRVTIVPFSEAVPPQKVNGWYHGPEDRHASHPFLARGVNIRRYHKRPSP